MKLIAEYTDKDLGYSITEDKKTGKKNVFIEGVFMSAELKNRNGRMYPKKVLMNEVQRYNKEYVAQNRAMGELGHPEGPTVNLERVSPVIEDCSAAVFPRLFICLYILA